MGYVLLTIYFFRPACHTAALYRLAYAYSIFAIASERSSMRTWNVGVETRCDVQDSGRNVWELGWRGSRKLELKMIRHVYTCTELHFEFSTCIVVVSIVYYLVSWTYDYLMWKCHYIGIGDGQAFHKNGHSKIVTVGHCCNTTITPYFELCYT